MQELEYLEKYSLPGEKTIAVVIWFHGLGADYNDFVPLVPELNLDKCVKFIFPNAMMRPITINNGYVMRAWYDIHEFSAKSLGESVDRQGINESVNLINKLVSKQIESGFKPEQIILAGFSQGGVMSYTTFLLSQYKLGGVVALSCYLPDADKLISSNSINRETPIFAAHGLQDPVVPFIAGLNAYHKLEASGFNIKWYEYPMGHSLCNEEINDLSAWFRNLLKNS